MLKLDSLALISTLFFTGWLLREPCVWDLASGVAIVPWSSAEKNSPFSAGFLCFCVRTSVELVQKKKVLPTQFFDSGIFSFYPAGIRCFSKGLSWVHCTVVVPYTCQVYNWLCFWGWRWVWAIERQVLCRTQRESSHCGQLEVSWVTLAMRFHLLNLLSPLPSKLGSLWEHMFPNRFILGLNSVQTYSKWRNQSLCSPLVLCFSRGSGPSLLCTVNAGKVMVGNSSVPQAVIWTNANPAESLFESEPKTKRFDPCPVIMSLPGARRQETIVIVLGLEDLLARSFWEASDIARISISGSIWLWEGDDDKLWELKFS